MIECITSDPAICGGKPCIRGMRIRVRDILEMLAGGDSVVSILAEFPDLVHEDVLASLASAADQINQSTVLPAVAA